MKHWNRYTETRGKHPGQVILTADAEDADDPYVRAREKMYRDRGHEVSIRAAKERDERPGASERERA